MQRCWSASPEDRPEFAEVVTALQTLIGSSFKTSKFMLDTDVTTGHQQLSLPNSPLKRWQQKVQNNLVNEKHDIVTMLYRPEQQEVWFGYSDNQIKIWDMKVRHMIGFLWLDLLSQCLFRTGRCIPYDCPLQPTSNCPVRCTIPYLECGAARCLHRE
jgi:hypothetical protein